MKYSYEFKKDPFGITRIKLSEELSVFSDVFEDISTEEEADEYVGYVKKVLDGEYQDFEITLNATSVSIKKDLTIAKHHYRIDEPFESTIETEGFLELMLIWKEKIAGIFGD
ncbi:tRNA-Val4 [Terribacillus halophilus]|nr:tRNA-Val4 [Terribacillus halophilus]